MPTAEQFWQYAQEAMFVASQADTDDDRRNLLELALVWTQAALVARRSTTNNNEAIGAGSFYHE